MTTVIVGMLVALALALVVVALVAVPARREGRDLLTPQGEQLVQTARDRTTEAASAAREKAVEVAGAARERVRGTAPDDPPEPPTGPPTGPPAQPPAQASVAEAPAQPPAEASAAESSTDERQIDLREQRARTRD